MDFLNRVEIYFCERGNVSWINMWILIFYEKDMFRNVWILIITANVDS